MNQTEMQALINIIEKLRRPVGPFGAYSNKNMYYSHKGHNGALDCVLEILVDWCDPETEKEKYD